MLFGDFNVQWMVRTDREKFESQSLILGSPRQILFFLSSAEIEPRDLVWDINFSGRKALSPLL